MQHLDISSETAVSPVQMALHFSESSTAIAIFRSARRLRRTSCLAVQPQSSERRGE